MESETPPELKPSRSPEQKTSPSALQSATALSTLPPGIPHEPSRAKPGGKSKRTSHNRDSSLEGNMQRSSSPTSAVSTVKYTRTGRVSKATKGQAIHHCDDCGKVCRTLRLDLTACVILTVSSRHTAAPAEVHRSLHSCKGLISFGSYLAPTHAAIA